MPTASFRAPLRSPLLLFVCAAGAALGAPAPSFAQAPAPSPAPASPAPERGEPSIESLLRVAHERAAKAKAEAATKLNVLIATLSLPYDANQNQIKKQIQEILECGEIATRPLVDALHDPENSPKGQNAAMALSESKEANVVDELAADLEKSKDPAAFRARAAWILGRHESPKTQALLMQLLDDGDASVVKQASMALGRLKVRESAPVLAAKLASAPGPTGRAILSALADVGDPKDAKVIGAVTAYLESPAALECVGSAAELLDGFRKQDAVRAKELMLPAMRILGKGTPPADDVELLLKAIRPLVNSADREVVAILKKTLADSTSYPVKMRAALALDSAKETSGANWLLKQPNDALKENPENTVLLRQRGQILIELRRYRDALHDYDDVKRISNARRLALNDPDFWIEYARCNAALKSMQAAADALKLAQTHGAKPKDYRDHEEFADLKKMSKNAALFEGDDAK